MHTSFTLKPDDRLILVDFGDAPLAYQKRLLALGLFPGIEVQFIRHAPLGCPLYIQANGRSIALRKKEAEVLSWEKV